MNTELNIYCQYSATRTLRYITRDISIQSQLSTQWMTWPRAGLFIEKAADWQTANSACQTADQRARWLQDTEYSRPRPSIGIWPCIVTLPPFPEQNGNVLASYDTSTILTTRLDNCIHNWTTYISQDISHNTTQCLYRNEILIKSLIVHCNESFFNTSNTLAYHCSPIMKSQLSQMHRLTLTVIQNINIELKVIQYWIIYSQTRVIHTWNLLETQHVWRLKKSAPTFWVPFIALTVNR